MLHFWLGAAVNLEPCETPETHIVNDDAIELYRLWVEVDFVEFLTINTLLWDLTSIFHGKDKKTVLLYTYKNMCFTTINLYL